MATPYSQQAPLKVKCVGSRRSQKALNFTSNNNIIDVGQYKVTTLSALTDGQTWYTSIKNGSDPEFEEGGSYIIKNYTLSKQYGRQCIFLNRSSRKFKTSPLAITEEAERAAKEVLCPPSPFVTGEEQEVFSSTGYLSLQGTIEKVQVARMTRAQYPLLDLSLRSGIKLLEVTLWREEALMDLYVGDKVEVSHQRANIRPNGGGKFDSSNYTTVKIVEREILEAVLTIIGVSEDNDMLILLDIQHIHHRVLKLEAVDTTEAAKSLDAAEDAESLDLIEAAESLDLIEATESLDLIEATEAAESLEVENTEA
ncbi:unnamed protein product [Leuciscus chuanchicus]